MNNDTIINTKKNDNKCDTGGKKQLFNYNIWFKYKTNISHNSDDDYTYLENQELNILNDDVNTIFNIGDIVQYVPKENNDFKNSRAKIIEDKSMSFYGGDKREETKEDVGEETKEDVGEETKEDIGEETKEDVGEETKEDIDTTLNSYKELNNKNYVIEFLNPPIINKKVVKTINASSSELKKAAIFVKHICSFPPFKRNDIENLELMKDVNDDFEKSEDIDNMKKKFFILRNVVKANEKNGVDMDNTTKKTMQTKTNEFNKILKILNNRWKTETIDDYEQIQNKKKINRYLNLELNKQQTKYKNTILEKTKKNFEVNSLDELRYPKITEYMSKKRWRKKLKHYPFYGKIKKLSYIFNDLKKTLDTIKKTYENDNKEDKSKEMKYKKEIMNIMTEIDKLHNIYKAKSKDIGDISEELHKLLINFNQYSNKNIFVYVSNLDILNEMLETLLKKTFIKDGNHDNNNKKYIHFHPKLILAKNSHNKKAKSDLNALVEPSEKQKFSIIDININKKNGNNFDFKENLLFDLNKSPIEFDIVMELDINMRMQDLVDLQDESYQSKSTGKKIMSNIGVASRNIVMNASNDLNCLKRKKKIKEIVSNIFANINKKYRETKKKIGGKRRKHRRRNKTIKIRRNKLG